MQILHLSDIHFGRNYPEYGISDTFDNKNKILDDLLRFISELDVRLKPEHIVVTGDIAWHGEKSEFDEAYEWFSELLRITGLSGKNIIFCVGNHDVNRNYLNDNLDLRANDVNRIDAIYKFENIYRMEPPIYEYNKFCERIGMEPYSFPLNGEREYSYNVGYKDITFSSGGIIRLFAFNTALLSGFSYKQIPDDKMWLGQEQIKSYYEYGIMPANDVNYSIALFHHAERFLDSHEICEYDGRLATLPLLLDSVDLALCGHTETGGRPVLMQQAGGGKILTGGATYYSDTHPNAFSIICIPDTKKDMCYQPYTFDGNWKEYNKESRQYKIKTLHEMPLIGEIHENCKMIVGNSTSSYEIPIKSLTIHENIQDGKRVLCMSNHKDVMRKLDIRCIAAVDGSNPEISVTLPYKMQNNVEAMMEHERYYKHLYNIFNSEEASYFNVVTEKGVHIYDGNGLNGTIDDTPEDSIRLLEQLIEIENYFGIKLNRPDIYELDVQKINILVELIHNGYTEQLKIGKSVESQVSSKKEISEIINSIKISDKYYIVYNTELWCELYGTKFRMGSAQILSGTYKIEKRSLKRKYKTFEDGDSRRINYYAGSDYRTFIILDPDKCEKEIRLDSTANFIGVNKMNLNFGFIYE